MTYNISPINYVTHGIYFPNLFFYCNWRFQYPPQTTIHKQLYVPLHVHSFSRLVFLFFFALMSPGRTKHVCNLRWTSILSKLEKSLKTTGFAGWGWRPSIFYFDHDETVYCDRIFPCVWILNTWYYLHDRLI